MIRRSPAAWLSRTFTALVVSSFASLAGCTDTESTSGDATTSTSTSGTTSSETPACATDPRAMTYAVGLSAASPDGNIVVTFVDADPAPPAKGNNTWTVQITAPAGSPPVTDPTIETTAYMPDHGHTSPIKPAATKLDDNGTYKIEPVNLFMPGIWEVTLTITPAGGSPAPVKFTFCVAG